MTIANTGLSEREAIEEGYDIIVCHNIKPEVGSQPCRSVSQGVGTMFCLPKTAWPPTSAL